MNVGYVRLSRDDDKKNSTSIENQKLIITNYAKEQGLVIDRWYEDDGVTGYKFDRPGFNQLMEDLDKDIERVYVKDFSRLGRHNAKVLLLLDEFQERGKQLIVIDDHYDSMHEEDDTIGIKTWFNERYVKDTSKKIRRVIGAKQKEGTLKVLTPFGYVRNEKDKSKVEIVPKEAEYIKMVYDLYIKGAGYRKIATHLTESNVPTPSMVRHERELKEGKVTQRIQAYEWSESMVKDILDNDYYIGTLRLGKRARATIHGKDKRVPKENHHVFENHHPAIIDKATFDLVQEIKEKRNRTNYRGSHGQWLGSEIPNPFGSCLICKDCGSRMIPMRRKTTSGERKYYICNTYNMKGKRYCSKAHLIVEKDLMQDVLTYIKLCRDSLCEVIATYDIEDFNSEKRSIEDKRKEILSSIEEQKKQLKMLFTQKVKDLANASGNEEIINETYDALQKDIFEQIHKLEIQLQKLNETSLENEDVKEKLENALQVVDKIIEKGTLDRKDIEILIEKIVVDENGFPEIILKYGLSGFIKYDAIQEMNRYENQIIYHTIRLIMEDDREFTSAKYLSKALTDLGYKKSKKSVLPYITLMMELEIVEYSGNPNKPYTVIKSKEEIMEILSNYSWAISSKNKNNSMGDQNLHGVVEHRWYASNGIRIYSEKTWS